MNRHNVVTSQRPETHHSGSGATARPLIRKQGDAVLLDSVQIDSQHPTQGYGTVYLTPDQVLEIHARLAQIALLFLHENRWGGEDPFAR